MKTIPFVCICMSLLCLLGLPVHSWGQQQMDNIEVRVYDPFHRVYIQGVQLDIDERIIDELPSGEINVRSISELKELHIQGVTDEKGVYKTRIDRNGNPYQWITVRAGARGYETMVQMATEVPQSGTAVIIIEMLPDRASLQGKKSIGNDSDEAWDDFIWKRKIKLEQEKMRYGFFNDPEYFNAPHDSKRESRKNLRTAAGCNSSFRVPKTVYVKGLINGYPGQCGSRGFTGNINFQDYVAGVIAAEMGSGFPLEALKAQSVAARTYALDNIERGNPANCGHAYTSAIPQKCIDATNATNNVVVLYDNNAIVALYSARCHGDYTRSASIPSCGLNDPSVAAPYCNSVSCTGHANCRNVSGENCCPKWNPERNRNEVVFGHGVGLCQRGTQDFANRGWGWERIIRHYYSNIELSCNGSCPSDLKLTAAIPSGTYKASSTITASGKTEGNVVFDTRNEIYLNPGFIVNTGSTFTAQIGSGCASSKDNAASTISASTGTQGQKLIQSIYPNPVSDQVTLEYMLDKEASVEFTLITLSGKMLKTFKDKKTLPTGSHSRTIDVQELPNGIYFIKVKTPYHTEALPILKN